MTIPAFYYHVLTVLPFSQILPVGAPLRSVSHRPVLIRLCDLRYLILRRTHPHSSDDRLFREHVPIFLREVLRSGRKHMKNSLDTKSVTKVLRAVG